MPQPASRVARVLRQQLLEPVGEQAEQTNGRERLHGSSEVIESVNGKFRYVVGERGREIEGVSVNGSLLIYPGRIPKFNRDLTRAVPKTRLMNQSPNNS
jgi:hypothetical protein